MLSLVLAVGCTASSAWLAELSCASAVAGTQGRFTFTLPGVATPTPCKMILFFDNPFWGSNEYSCVLSADDGANCGGKVSCSVEKGEGNTAVLLTTVKRSS